VDEFLAGKLADQLVGFDGLDQFIAIGQLGAFAAGMGEDDLIEFLIGLRIADQAGEGGNPGAGGDHVEALARLERVEDERAGRLLAQEELVARLDVLEARGERSVGDLDGVEVQGFVPEGAGQGIGAQERFAVLLGQADHDEFARAETESVRPRDAEVEETIRIMLHLEHGLDGEGARLGRNRVRRAGRRRGRRHGIHTRISCGCGLMSKSQAEARGASVSAQGGTGKPRLERNSGLKSLPA
jgi:hypothetical protein